MSNGVFTALLTGEFTSFLGALLEGDPALLAGEPSLITNLSVFQIKTFLKDRLGTQINGSSRRNYKKQAQIYAFYPVSHVFSK